MGALYPGTDARGQGLGRWIEAKPELLKLPQGSVALIGFLQGIGFHKLPRRGVAIGLLLDGDRWIVGREGAALWGMVVEVLVRMALEGGGIFFGALTLHGGQHAMLVVVQQGAHKPGGGGPLLGAIGQDAVFEADLFALVVHLHVFSPAERPHHLIHDLIGDFLRKLLAQAVGHHEEDVPLPIVGLAPVEVHKGQIDVLLASVLPAILGGLGVGVHEIGHAVDDVDAHGLAHDGLKLLLQIEELAGLGLLAGKPLAEVEAKHHLVLIPLGLELGLDGSYID